VAIFDKEDTDSIAELINVVFANLTGPISDLIRATTNATVDSLIDGRSRMITAGWPEDIANLMCISIVNRNADVAKQIAEAINKAQTNQKKA
jgi:hypothetical protein